MILQALDGYYQRQRARNALAPAGFEPKQIPFVVVINGSGQLVQIDDTRSGIGKQRQAMTFLVPQGVKKTSGVAANLLWDTAEYALGIDSRGNPERVGKQHAAFKARLDELHAAGDDPGLRALHHFLSALDLSRLEQEPVWAEIRETNPAISFRLSDDVGVLICQRPAISAITAGNPEATDDAASFCLVTGSSDAIARLHPAIKGVWGAQTSGANIVSFNLDAFNSYAKQQGGNAPVGERAAFNYTTALNHLLRKGSTQRMQVGDASTVFWAAGDTSLEERFPSLFGDEPKDDDPDRGSHAVRNLYASIHNGVYVGEDAETEFFVLGLAPNAARLAIRFWHHARVKDIALAVHQHHADLNIAHAGFEKDYLSLFRLLVSTAVLGKSENIPPNLGGDTIRAILSQTPYPATLLQAAVRRCRAERAITYPRAALIKASLNRLVRNASLPGKELTVSLDRDNESPGYCLGRLFSALEKLQQDAQPGINATILDRYYGAASSAPATVFPILLKLKNHHLSKVKGERKGAAVRFEKLIGEIVDKLSGFPSRLSLQEQGLFAIGYYHQQQSFYASKKDAAESGATIEETTGEEP